mgnify:CR=1 FL=1
MDQELIIIGGGPAGMTAALYALRAGRRVLLLEADTCGGQITHTAQVDNYPGLPGISGLELADRMLEQILDLGAVVEPDRASALSRIAGGWRVTGEFGAYEAPAVIYAAGTTHRQLDVPGEAQRVGRGVSFCAVCDGAFYAGQHVAVVGGGNTALQEIALLAETCAKVTVVQNLATLTGEQRMIDLLQSKDNIEYVYNTVVDAYLTEDGAFRGLRLHHTDTETFSDLVVDGAFLAIGTEPENGPFAGVSTLNDWGYIQADEGCQTGPRGIYAAGDCRTKAIRQLTTAAGDGAVAGLAACRYVENVPAGSSL